MSLRSAQVNSLALHRAWSTSLLPFLYQTQTLLSQPLTPRRFTVWHKHCIHQRRADCSRRHYSNAFKDNASARRRATSSDFNIPFENVESKPQPESPKSKQSTLTRTEKAIFDRIYKDINEASSKSGDEGKVLHDGEDTDPNPYEDLNIIFDAAIQRLRQQQALVAEKAAKRQIRPYAPHEKAIDQAIVTEDALLTNDSAFIRPLKLANGVVLGAEMDWKENEEQLRKACEDHKALITDMLDQAISDVQIWAVLEDEVFKLVKHLNDQIEAEEKVRKAQDREKRKAAKEHNKAGKDRTTTNGETARDRDSARNGHSPNNNNPNSIALPTTTLFTILQSNYADYLLHALRLLRRHHPTSPYAPSLLPTLKRLGPISYVLGATPSLYNEILFLKWTQFSDLHGMADLMQEMINQGIEWNEVTMVLVRRIARRRKEALEGRWGVVARKWWGMRGNVEGWGRAWGLYEGVRRESRERAEREALVGVADRGLEGEGDEESI